MYVFETVTTSEREMQRISTAFYRFLERHSSDDIDDAAMHIERTGDRDGDRVSIRLWSNGAIDAYRAYLSTFVVPPPKGLLFHA